MVESRGATRVKEEPGGGFQAAGSTRAGNQRKVMTMGPRRRARGTRAAEKIRVWTGEARRVRSLARGEFLGRNLASLRRALARFLASRRRELSVRRRWMIMVPAARRAATVTTTAGLPKWRTMGQRKRSRRRR